jgi:uncharacterized protein involved in exopolysaccharide biosynthesis
MEQSEIVQRIFGQHRWLILSFVAFAIAGAALLHVGDSRSYTAATRIVLDTPDPTSRAEAIAISDTARAIATSPGQVAAALAAAHVRGRDPVAIARDDVSVRALGSSGILELTAKDRDPRVAAAIANSLAGRVIKARLEVTQGQIRDVLDDVTRQIDTLSARIAAADAHIDALNLQTAAASNAEGANTLRAQRDEESRRRDFLAQQRSVLESERVGLLSDDALRPKPSIISRASVPSRSDPSRLPVDLALGALLGLILGVGAAAFIEAFRPTVVGGDALAKEFGVPLLGTLPGPPDDGHIEPGDIPARVGVAARAAALKKVALVPVGPQIDVGPLAERLQAARSPRSSTKNAGAAVIRPFDPAQGMQNGSGDGLVLVAPSTVKKADAMEAGHLLTISRLPLLGLITYGRPRRRRSAAADVSSRETP